MPAKAKKPKAPKKPRKPNVFVQVIKNIVEVPAGASTSFWAKESKLAKALVEKLGEEKVLAYTPTDKTPSLAYLIACGGLEERIERNWRLKQFVPIERKTFELGEKIGPEVGIVPKNDTIRSWLENKTRETGPNQNQ